MNPDIEFVPLDEKLVEVITPWWNDPETKKWMGGYPPAKALAASSIAAKGISGTEGAQANGSNGSCDGAICFSGRL